MSRLIRLSFLSSCLCFIGLLALTALPGCTKEKTPVKDAAKDKTTPDHEDVGPHGGPCAVWGNEEFHAELIVKADKKEVWVYVLGSDPMKAPKEGTKVTDVKVNITSAKPEPILVKLEHDPKESGEKGIAFKGTHDAFAKPDGMTVNISGVVDGKPAYNGDVTYKKARDVANLFLKPGGIYTEADIKANGGQTPDQKFKGKRFVHSDVKQAGEMLCPVTGQKANADCDWIVGGERYQFCCRPCVDDFIEWAHHTPTKIKKADEYIYKGM